MLSELSIEGGVEKALRFRARIHTYAPILHFIGLIDACSKCQYF